MNEFTAMFPGIINALLVTLALSAVLGVILYGLLVKTMLGRFGMIAGISGLLYGVFYLDHFLIARAPNVVGNVVLHRLGGDGFAWLHPVLAFLFFLLFLFYYAAIFVGVYYALPFARRVYDRHKTERPIIGMAVVPLALFCFFTCLQFKDSAVNLRTNTCQIATNHYDYTLSLGLHNMLACD